MVDRSCVPNLGHVLNPSYHYLAHFSRTMQVEAKVVITLQQSFDLVRMESSSEICLQSVVALECFKIIASMASVNVTDCHLAHHS